MANLHNTLYVTSEGAYVSKSGESAVVKVDGAVRMQVPLHHLASIVCFWLGRKSARSSRRQVADRFGGRRGLKAESLSPSLRCR
jgi:hypothetical protein